MTAWPATWLGAALLLALAGPVMAADIPPAARLPLAGAPWLLAQSPEEPVIVPAPAPPPPAAVLPAPAEVANDLDPALLVGTATAVGAFGLAFAAVTAMGLPLSPLIMPTIAGTLAGSAVARALDLEDWDRFTVMLAGAAGGWLIGWASLPAITSAVTQRIPTAATAAAGAAARGAAVAPRAVGGISSATLGAISALVAVASATLDTYFSRRDAEEATLPR